MAQQKLYVRKMLLDIMSTSWWESDVSQDGITKDQIINVCIDEGKVWLIYWSEEEEEEEEEE